MTRIFLVAGAMMLSGATAVGQRLSVRYDDFCKLPEASKQEALSKMSPENVSEITASHLRRFYSANRDRLSRDQFAGLSKSIEALQFSVMGALTKRESLMALREMEERLTKVFSQEDLLRLNRIKGGCIATK